MIVSHIIKATSCKVIPSRVLCQAGRGLGAHGERDTAAGARLYVLRPDHNPRPEPQRRHPLETYWWYNCNMRYKVLEVLEALQANADGVATLKGRE